MPRLKDKWSQRIRLPSGQLLTRDVTCVTLSNGNLQGKIKLDRANRHYLVVTCPLALSEWTPMNPSDPDLTSPKWRSTL